MKKIFAHGKKEFIVVCRNCGCKFSYELEDIVAKDYVTCPECDVRISHHVEPDDIFSDNDKMISITRDEWKKIRKTTDICDDKGK